MRIPKKNTITILAGTAILLAGIGLIAFTSLDEKVIESGLVTMGMVMIVIGFVNSLKKKQGVAKDELTRKIADRAAAYSWVITLLALLLVYWLHHFEVVRFTVQGVIGITYLVMVATMIAFQRRFWKRGDVA
ncbi:hypothetical protein KY327_00435 [Candidatus Woesearchaeota archaeon]|nr:hypothetical protein [Candidatus Woesearchaeota archaeon]